jgi:hypothetical protein
VRQDRFGSSLKHGRRTSRTAWRAQFSRRCATLRSIARRSCDLTAWELTIRALPYVTAVDAAAEGMALELLEEAMKRAPHDPLPIATAAWCRGLRAGHHFTARPLVETAMARELAARA